MQREGCEGPGRVPPGGVGTLKDSLRAQDCSTVAELFSMGAALNGVRFHLLDTKTRDVAVLCQENLEGPSLLHSIHTTHINTHAHHTHTHTHTDTDTPHFLKVCTAADWGSACSG